MQPSIHDSLLTGYVVDGVARTLILHTRPHQGGGTHWIDVVFHGLGWDSRRENVENFFLRNGTQLFELSSSYGMHGWIAAERMEQVIIETPDSRDFSDSSDS